MKNKMFEKLRVYAGYIASLHAEHPNDWWKEGGMCAKYLEEVELLVEDIQHGAIVERRKAEVSAKFNRFILDNRLNNVDILTISKDLELSADPKNVSGNSNNEEEI